MTVSKSFLLVQKYVPLLSYIWTFVIPFLQVSSKYRGSIFSISMHRHIPSTFFFLTRYIYSIYYIYLKIFKGSFLHTGPPEDKSFLYLFHNFLSRACMSPYLPTYIDIISSSIIYRNLNQVYTSSLNSFSV